MASPTSITQLHTNIVNQVQSNQTLTLDNTIITNDDIQQINTDFGLAVGANLTITDLTTADIPSPSGQSITITKGSVSVLGASSTGINLIFTVVSNKVQLNLEIEFSDWKLSSAFSSEALIFPFDSISFSNTNFIYSSVAVSKFTPKYGSYGKVDLATGLNLISTASLTALGVLANLFSSKQLATSFTIFGSFNRSTATAYPICMLQAELPTPKSVLSKVDLKDLYLFVEITDPQTGYIQDFNFGIEAKGSLFDYKIYFGYDNSSANFQVLPPSTGSPTSIDKIFSSDLAKSLFTSTSGLTIDKLVPSDMKAVFQDIDFLGASFGYSFSTSKATYASFKIGQDPSKTSPFKIGSVLEFTDLVFEADWMDYGSGLTPSFVFSGDSNITLGTMDPMKLNFLIKVEKDGTGMAIDVIEVKELGSISLKELIHDLDSSLQTPEELEKVTIGELYFKYDKTSSDFTGSLTGQYTSTILNNPFYANMVLSLNYSGGIWTPEVKGGFGIGNEYWTDIDIKLQKKSGGDTNLIFTGSSNNIPLSDLINEIASDLGITNYSFIDFDLTNFKIAYNADSTGTVSIGDASMSSDFTIGDISGDFSLVAKKNGETWEFYVKADVGAGHPIDLGKMIPVVGSISALQGQVIFDDIGLYVTSKTIDAIPNKPDDLVAGLSMSLNGKLGGEAVNPVIPLYIYKSNDDSGGDNDTEMLAVIGEREASSTTPSQNIKWFDFSKTIDPVTLKKFGFLPSGDDVAIYPDIVLSKGGVELDLDGLSIDVSVKELLQKKLDASFNIDGLGVSYQSDTLELSGQFLKNTVTSPPPASKNLTGYLGEVVAHFSRFGLSAIGGYIPAQEGYPESLFIYANLDGTLGGSPALYVTGIAFGFGLNYELIPPTLKDLGTYPLIPVPTSTTPKANGPSDIGPALDSLNGTVIQEQAGENWIAAGIQVTSYNMITGFALVSVSFGLETYIGILGSVSMTLPKGDPEPLGNVEIDATVNFNPSSGLLPILGVVSPSSYFLDGVITLTGGFAFYIWYGGANKGDFVFTIGGYYPGFTIPSNYPKVAPLSINFDMGPFKANGSAYLALTPGAFMAGFRYTASWSFANISAWYSLGLDFLVEWAPFSYQGDAYVSVGVSVDLALFTVHASIGADAVVWGPKFGGKAHVDLDVVSFTIHFGSDQITPPPVSWSEFEQKFLPSGLSQQGSNSGTQDLMTMVVAPAAVPTQSGKNVAASAAKGLLKSGIKVGGVAYDWLMDPNHFEIDTASKIPSNNAYWTSAKGTEYTIPNVAAGTVASATNPEVDPFPGNTTWCTTVNLKPMKLSDVISNHTISLIKADNDGSFTSDSAIYVNDISITPIFNNSNAALWGKVETSDKKDPNNQLLENTLEGFTITPMPRDPSKVSQLPLIDLIFEEGNDEYFNYTQKDPDTTYNVTVSTDTDAELEIDITGGTPPSSPLKNNNLVLNSLTDSWVEGKRNSILDDLNMYFNTFKSSEVTLTDMATSEQLNNWPQVEILGA